MFADLRQRLPSWGSYAWWIAILIYICVQGVTHIQILQGRNQPPETDDAYTYLWQAVHLDVCRHSCPALDSLAPILQTPSDDVDLNNRRVDETSRLLSVYAPLQEGVLLMLQRVTGLEWGNVYWVFIGIGVLLQGFGIGLLLRALWGAWPAAFGLFIVTFTVYVGQGLIYVVPSNVTLTIAMIVWSFLIRDGRSAWRILIIGALLLVFSHSVGRVYALTALALYIVGGHWKPTSRELAVVTAVLTMVAGYWLFARTSTTPVIDSAFPYLNHSLPTYQDVLFYQLRDALSKIVSSVQELTLFPYALIDALCLIWAFRLMPGSPQQRRSALTFFALAIGMLISAAFISLAAYPAEGNRRVVIIFQISLTGALGTLMVWSLGRIYGLLRQRLSFRRRKQVVELFVVMMVLIVSWGTWILLAWHGISNHNAVVHNVTKVQNYNLAREDLETLFDQPQDTILYTDEVAMLYGLTNGLHRFNAIYLNIMDGPFDLTQVDSIVGLQTDPGLDPLAGLKNVFPEESIEEEFILVDGLKSDLRIYVRRPEQ